MTPRVAFTVGYQGVPLGRLVNRLKAAGVTLVLDTRRHPTSRRPDFRRQALQGRLAKGGMLYESRPSLGVPKRIRPLARQRRWLFEAAYRGVLKRAELDVSDVIRLTASERVALLCFETDPWECHRSLLAAAISDRAPVTFTDLSSRNGEDPNDHPVSEHVMSTQDEMHFSAR